MVDVIIPAYRPDGKFLELLRSLQSQTVKPNRILIIHTVTSDGEEEWEASVSAYGNVEVFPIGKEEFDHGGTRDYGASLSQAQYLLFMTQDAVPCNGRLIEELIKPMSDGRVAASYARQLPGKEAGTIERYARRFNYPPQSRAKSSQDVKEMGIKAFFCSNVCALYRKETYEELGGFVKRTIFNEDMILAHDILMAGKLVYYAADAKVAHSHRYTYRAQFQRNFDLAVSHKEYERVFSSVPPESEGARLVKDTAKHLLRKGKGYLIPDLIITSAFKYLGYKAGLNYDKIPLQLIKRLSMNPSYWNGEAKSLGRRRHKG